MFPIEFRSSMFERVNMDWDTFHDAIEEAGFEHQESVAGDRVHYHENDAGFGITLVNGPRANLMFPSGPVRGRLFGSSGLRFGSGRDRLEELAERVRNNAPTQSSYSGSRGSTGNEVRA